MPDAKRTRRQPSPVVTTSEDAARHLNPLDMTLMEKHRQCPATSKRTGQRCKNLCSLGMRTCRLHGSGTMRAKVAAAERIRAAAGYAAALLVELMADPAVDVKLRADLARDILTRAGIEEAKHLQIEATVEAPWQKLIREGAVIKVLHRTGDAAAAEPVDAAQAARRAGLTVTKPVELTTATVPRSDSEEARQMYLASKSIPDPMPPQGFPDVRVDGPRPRMSERQRRRRA